MFPDAMINFHYCFLSYLAFLVPHSPYLSLFYQNKFHFFCKDRGKIRTTYNGEFLFEPHSFLLSLCASAFCLFKALLRYYFY